MAKSKQSLEVEGRKIAVSNLEKVLYPAAHFTMGQVVDYYVHVAPYILPHLTDRPVIPTKYGGESVLEALSLPSKVRSDLSELETNERTIAERGGNSAIGPGELLYGVPEAHIVNAAFTHHGPNGGRFDSPQRATWYAGVELETSVAEVAFHKRRFLKKARLTGSMLLSIRTSSPISQVNFTILIPTSHKPASSLDPSHNATARRKHWLTRFCTQAQTGLSTRAYATLPVPALRASGQPWCSILAAARSIASHSELQQTRHRLSRSFIHFEQLRHSRQRHLSAKYITSPRAGKTEPWPTPFDAHKCSRCSPCAKLITCPVAASVAPAKRAASREQRQNQPESIRNA